MLLHAKPRNFNQALTGFRKALTFKGSGSKYFRQQKSKNQKLMKTFHTLLAGVTLFAGSFCTDAAYAQQNAVSIVFTGQPELQSVDTIIANGNEALDNLLSQYKLSANDVQIINIDLATASSNAAHQVSVLSSEDITRNDETGETIKVVRIERSVSNSEPMNKEERERFEEQTELIEMQRQAHTRQKEVREMEREVEMDESEHLSVRIDRTEEDGTKVVKAWVNGEQVSEEEAQRLMDEHGTEIRMDERMEHARVMRLEADSRAEHAEAMASRVAIYSHGEPKQAIVIMKKVATTGTNKQVKNAEGNLSIYPNPANDNVKVKFDGNIEGSYELNITNLAGQTIWSQSDQNSGSMLQKIDTRDFAPGTYIVSLSHDKGIHTQKLVVE